jgi:hypothetical protein
VSGEMRHDLAVTAIAQTALVTASRTGGMEVRAASGEMLRNLGVTSIARTALVHEARVVAAASQTGGREARAVSGGMLRDLDVTAIARTLVHEARVVAAAPAATGAAGGRLTSAVATAGRTSFVLVRRMCVFITVNLPCCRHVRCQVWRTPCIDAAPAWPSRRVAEY